MSIYICAIFSFLTIAINSLTVKQIEWQKHLSSTADYTNMSYYNLCGIRSQHSTISKGEKGDSLEHIYLHYTLPTFAL